MRAIYYERHLDWKIWIIRCSVGYGLILLCLP